MSTNLPSIDLTGAIVGTKKTLDFTAFVKQLGLSPGITEPAHIRIYNESGCGLNAQFQQSGRTEFVPAGAWPEYDIEYNDSFIIFTVTYTLPNPPVSTINAVYYAPTEKVPDMPQLGNSPIGIGGTVNVSSVQTLSNEGQAANILVIDMGDIAFNQLVTMYNDGHMLWSVDASGTKHQVLKINATANYLQLGQSGDTVEVLGNLSVDATSNFQGVNAAQQITAQATGTALSVPNGNLSALQTVVAGGLNTNTIRDNVSGASQITLATAGISVVNPIQSALSIVGALTESSNIILNTPATSTVNGSVAGSVSWYFPVWGTGLKVVIIQYSGYNTVNTVNVQFPGLANKMWFKTGNHGASGPISALNGATNVNFGVTTALGAAGSAGSTGSNANLFGASLGEVEQAIDRVHLNSTAGAVLNCQDIGIGI